jgi:hypothetical protein
VQCCTDGAPLLPIGVKRRKSLIFCGEYLLSFVAVRVISSFFSTSQKEVVGKEFRPGFPPHVGSVRAALISSSLAVLCAVYAVLNVVAT